LLALGLSSIFLLAFAAEAEATTYCVAKASCVAAGGTTEPGLVQALAAADAHAGRDRIEIGPGNFNSGGAFYLDGSTNPVDIVGAGAGTVLANNADPVVSIQDPTSTLSAVTVALAVENSAALELHGTADGIVVVGDTGRTSSGVGVSLYPGSTLRGSTLSLSFGEPSFSTVGVRTEAGAGTATVEDVSVLADSGFDTVAAAGTTNIRRVKTRGHFGVVMVGGTTNLDDAVIELFGASLMYGVEVDPNRGSANTSATMNASHVTVFGPGGGGIAGFQAVAGTGVSSATLNVSNSIARGVGHSLVRNGAGANPANLTIAYSDYDPATLVQSGPGTLTQGAGNVNVDPLFVDGPGGDYHLTAASPLLEAGDPAAGGFPLDRDGAPRVTDANGDCTPRRDMGAFEFQPSPRSPHAAAAATPASVASGTPATFDAGASCDPDGGTLTYAWSFDDGTSAAGITVQHPFSTAGTHTGTVTVTDPTGRTATAAASVTVTTPPPTGPVPGICVNVFTGTEAADTIRGSAFGDTINGLAGNDKLSGVGGDDCVRGNAGNDRLDGGAGNDKLTGGTGNDKLSGGSGEDRLSGEAGNDRLSGGSGKNTFYGGSGKDTISARNGEQDRIDCGTGKDKVTADRVDRVKQNCERISLPPKKH
jgi:hypothetical protein